MIIQLINLYGYGSTVESFYVEYECYACATPLIRVVFGLEKSSCDVLGCATPGRLVNRAALHFADIHGFVHVVGLDDDDRHFSVQELGNAVDDDQLVPVESGAFDFHAEALTEHQTWFLVCLEQVFRVGVDALGDHIVLVERLLFLLAGLLFDGVDLADWVVDLVELDDARDRVDCAVHLAQVLQTLFDGVHPRGQAAQGGETPLHPKLGDAVLQHAGHRSLDFVREVGFAFLRQFEHYEGVGYGLAELVDALELLDKAVLERLAFLTVDADFANLVLAARLVRRLVSWDAFFDELDFLVDHLGGSAASASGFFSFAFCLTRVEGQDVEQEAKHVVGEQDARRGFGVRVHADGNRRLLFDALVDVLLLSCESH